MSSSHQGLSKDQFVLDTLRLTDEEWYECVSELDRDAANAIVSHERRSDERVPYRNLSTLLVTIRSVDGRQLNYRARPYDLSRSGIGFLHGTFMHMGLDIDVHLKHRELGMTKLHAHIHCCYHIKDSIHRIGAQFDSPIDVDDYLLA
ncbi:MAG: PilZ domain-containing protein [Planctomycetota bacterium]